VVSTAHNLLGLCRYGVFGAHYKNPFNLFFRCDGLVEHCYESIIPTPSQVQHRGGLFEDDTWKSLSPAALRNCLFELVDR